MCLDAADEAALDAADVVQVPVDDSERTDRSEVAGEVVSPCRICSWITASACSHQRRLACLC